jgi:drug/metabolite transporter (DMT)-like permease
MSITTITNDTSRKVPTPITRRSAQRNGLGTVLSVAAAAFFGLGANVSKVALHAGLDPIRLTALRCTGTAIGLLAVILVVRPALLRIRRADLPVLIVLGLTGAAAVQFLFFTAIDRLPVGIALLIEFTAPFMIAVYSQVVLRHPADRRSWIAIALGMSGLALVAKVWTDTGLDPIGVAAGLGAAGCLAAFFMIGKNALQRHHPLTMSFWMFAIASVFWAAVAPWWNFDIAVLGTNASVLGVFDATHLPVWTSVVWVVLLGTLVPYLLEIASLEHLTPTAKGVVGMSEPLIAAAIAWAWLGEALDNIQLAGATVTLLGIFIIQSRRAASSSSPTSFSTDSNDHDEG